MLIILLDSLFFHNLILARYVFPRICPYTLGHQFVIELSCIIISSDLINFYGVNFAVSLVTSDFIYQSVLSILVIAKGLPFFLQHQE